MDCKICNNTTKPLFETKVLGKYNVQYFQCENCQFIQTENPYWLEEAYGNAITKLDIGLVQRNILYSNEVEEILLNNDFDQEGKFVDYGGGYGMFVRLMRDKGFNYYRQDYYCENFFAEYFDIKDISQNTNFELLTAFEVFEHIPEPKEELKTMFTFSKNILFSTLIQPKEILTPDNWWYFIPETGQHVSLYTLKSLEILAQQNNKHFYSNGSTLHLFTEKKLEQDPFQPKQEEPQNNKGFIDKFFGKKIIIPQKNLSRESLLQKDFEYIKNMLR